MHSLAVITLSHETFYGDTTQLMDQDNDLYPFCLREEHIIT